MGKEWYVVGGASSKPPEGLSYKKKRQQNITKEGGVEGECWVGFKTLKPIPGREEGNLPIGKKNTRGYKMGKGPISK